MVTFKSRPRIVSVRGHCSRQGVSPSRAERCPLAKQGEAKFVAILSDLNSTGDYSHAAP